MNQIVFSSDFGDGPIWKEAIARRRSDVELVEWSEVKDPDRIVFGLVWRPPPSGLGIYPNLKGLQSLGAGVNQLNLAELPKGVPLARLIEESLTETMVDYAIGSVYRHFREFDRFERETREAKWEFRFARFRREFTVGVMGLGVLGTAMADTLVKLGLPVIGWATSPKTIPGVESYVGDAELDTFLSRSKLLLNILPLTPQTADILNATTLGKLPKGAYVVNIGRGGHLVEPDLVALVKSGHIAGATLDVTKSEPLNSDSPLFTVPEITITPHIAGNIDPESACVAVLENYDRALAGQTLRNQVDLARGY
ncbi:2-hydroxyacid dehydrogenase [Zavarzinia sp. CC-PAN008]|uniref:2-hydroxyacid dehydrogenase n=1 Tax=Zavarzinia sp. CC-PAN008 TaxID=3243332 RepID=UPI003F7480E5